MQNVEQTIISQYANSPTLVQLVRNMDAYIDPSVNFAEFYDFVWNVDTAVGFGLDIWGRIVDVSRLLRIPGNTETLGFNNATVPPDWAPFNQGTWHTGLAAGEAYLLPDNVYRTLILTKALANIADTSAPSINQLLRNLFPGRGRCYIRDNLDMTVTFVFEFSLTTIEYAILTQSRALPHTTGVGYDVLVVPSGLFGFSEMGDFIQPFDFGTFYVPAGTVLL